MMPDCNIERVERMSTAPVYLYTMLFVVVYLNKQHILM